MNYACSVHRFHTLIYLHASFLIEEHHGFSMRLSVQDEFRCELVVVLRFGFFTLRDAFPHVISLMSGFFTKRHVGVSHQWCWRRLRVGHVSK